MARSIRRPAVVHALWLIVLLKLVTPPLLQIPLRNSQNVESTTDSRSYQYAGPLAFSTSQIRTVEEQPNASGAAKRTGAVDSSPFAALSWTGTLGLIWAAGSLTWFLRRSRDSVRFSERVADSWPADEALQSHVNELARRLGLSTAPQVVVVPSVISPMLWGLGSRTRLLFPSRLLDSLDPASLDTLLVHELAHYRRGDHFVRLLEFLVSGLLWWHPLVWWVRRELETYEEKACDAWVVTRLPGSRRRYAEALLATLDFLSLAPAPLPPVATGIGDVPLLRERLTEIMRGPPEPRIPSGEKAGLIFTGLMALFFSPNWHRPDSDLRGTAQNSLAAQSPGDEPNDVASESSAATGSPATLEPAPLGTVTQSSLSWKRSIPPWNEVRAIVPLQDPRFARPSSGVFGEMCVSQWSVDRNEPQSAFAYSPDGDYVATVNESHHVQYWDLTQRKVVREFKGHKDLVQSFAFSPGGTLLATGSRDGEVFLWNLHSRLQPGRLVSQTLPVNAIAISPEGDLLGAALGTEDGSAGKLVVFDVFTGKQRLEMVTPQSLAAVRFLDDGHILSAVPGIV
ncbi:MAG: M48 family metalloprotease, partial [Planctomycetota bacterium]|nr:M48 family metalloprotease [Planctomycetota bacterium]